MKYAKNKEIANIFKDIARLWELNTNEKNALIRGRNHRIVAVALERLSQDIEKLYRAEGRNGIKAALEISDHMAQKIEEYLTTGKLKYYEELKKKTAIRDIITHFFISKGISPAKLKMSAKKEKIMYSRFTKPAKDLLELAGSLERAKEAIDKVAEWAHSRNLDYAIETVFKKWLELDRLKPKEIVKKPYYQGYPMVWSEIKHKWYVIDQYGDWLEFAGKEEDIEWRIIK